jgi:hypothetical protein
MGLHGCLHVTLGFYGVGGTRAPTTHIISSCAIFNTNHRGQVTSSRALIWIKKLKSQGANNLFFYVMRLSNSSTKCKNILVLTWNKNEHGCAFICRINRLKNCPSIGAHWKTVKYFKMEKSVETSREANIRHGTANIHSRCPRKIIFQWPLKDSKNYPSETYSLVNHSPLSMFPQVH